MYIDSPKCRALHSINRPTLTLSLQSTLHATLQHLPQSICAEFPQFLAEWHSQAGAGVKRRKAAGVFAWAGRYKMKAFWGSEGSYNGGLFRGTALY